MAKELEKGHPRGRTPHGPSLLILLRVWIVRNNTTQGAEDLNGKLQDPVSGQIQSFSGGIELVRVLRRMILMKEAASPGKAANDSETGL